jgi:hypothetical protein
MPQFEFYFSDKEIQELFNFIQLKGGKFVPDVFYDTEAYKLISDYEDFLRYQKDETIHFFLLADEYFFEPLKVSRNRFLEEPSFSINQRKGGPYIDFSFYRGYNTDLKIPYKMSVVDHYSKFIHSDNSDEFETPDELKRFYKDIIKFIKSRCKVRKINAKNYRISAESINES